MLMSPCGLDHIGLVEGKKNIPNTQVYFNGFKFGSVRPFCHEIDDNALY